MQNSLLCFSEIISPIPLILSGFCQGFHHLPETRGLCLSEEQTVTSV